MSVNYTFSITPKSNTLVGLKDVKAFISNLIKNKCIEKEFTLFTGDYLQVLNIDAFSVSAIDNQLKIVKEIDFDKISDVDNYAFKIDLTNVDGLFDGLSVFEITERKNVCIFVLFFGKPMNFEVINQSEEDEYETKNIKNINCIITSSGVDASSLEGLVENQDEYDVFFSTVKDLFGEFEVGGYED